MSKFLSKKMFSRLAFVSIVSVGSIGTVGTAVEPTQAKPLQFPSSAGAPAKIAPASTVKPQAVPSQAVPAGADVLTEIPAKVPAKVPAKTPAKAPATDLGSVVDVASKNSSFKALVTAIEAAGLVDKLSGDGPFTILAPTDAAFEELPAGVLQALLQPGNKDLLTQILTYHVVPEKLKFEQFRSGALATINGGVAVKLMSDRIVINNASIIQADVEADNGIIQVISRVLIPPKVAEELQTRLAAAAPPEPKAPIEAEASPQPANSAEPSTEPAAKPAVRGLW